MRSPLIAAVVMLAGGLSAAPDAVAGTLSESLRADRLVLADMAGRLRLEPSPDDRLHLGVSWEAPLTVALERRDGAAVLTARDWPGGGTTIVGQSTRVEVGPGATSSVTIGGGAAAPGGASAPRLEGTLRLPEGTRLVLEGATGDLSGGAILGGLSGDLAGAPRLVLTVRGPLDVRAAGGGDLTLAGVRGPATVRLTGAPSISLEDCAVDDLTVELVGAGRLRVGCPVEDADVRIVGGGEVVLDAVRGDLARSVLGGRLTIGE